MESSTQAIGDLLANIRRLPPLPGGVARLMSLVPSAPGYYEEAVSIVRADAALATQALKIANSAMFAGQSPVMTVDKALMRVGARLIATTLTEGHIKRSFDVRDEVLGHIWLVNALKANLAFALAQRHAIGVNPEAAYTYGLLHDLGRLVMAALWRNAVSELVDEDPRPQADLLRREEEVCGMTHVTAGRLLGNRWKLPSDVVLVVAAHHLPRSARTAFPPELNRAIELMATVDEATHAASHAGDGPDAVATAVNARFNECESAQSAAESAGVSPAHVAQAMKPALAAAAKQRRALGLGDSLRGAGPAAA